MFSLLSFYGQLGWSYSQIKALVIVTKIVGSFSCLGSAYIIYDVLKDPRKRCGLNSQYHRIMIAMSTFEFISSFFGPFLTTWPMPVGYHLYAVGNMKTCEAVAFMQQLGSCGTTLYNCSLMTYILLKIKYRCTRSTMKNLEKWFHIIPCCTCLAIAVLGASLTIYGPGFFTCWFATLYPINCERTGDEAYCKINKEGIMIFNLLRFFIVICSLLYVGVITCQLHQYVREIERGVNQFDFLARFQRAQSQAQNNASQSNYMLRQGLLYNGALFIVWIFPIIFFVNAIIDLPDIPSSYVLYVLNAIFHPMQGIFNCIIYAMPKEYKQKHKRSSLAIPIPSVNPMTAANVNNDVTISQLLGGNESDYEKKYSEEDVNDVEVDSELAKMFHCDHKVSDEKDNKSVDSSMT